MRVMFSVALVFLGFAALWLYDESAWESDEADPSPLATAQDKSESAKKDVARKEQSGKDDDSDEVIPSKIGPVKIIYKITSDFYPTYWKNDPAIKPVAKPVDRKQLLRTIPLIQSFVKEYPEEVLKKNLHGLYICKTLQFYGKDFGGTNSANGVYICVRTPTEGYTNTYLLSSMHHEFSSILMRNYNFPTKKWSALNPEDFKYANDAVGFLSKKNLLVPQAKYHKEGFVCLYSQASMEEDFNTIADYLFNQRDALYKIASEYPRLKAKVLLSMEFYKTVDNRFAFGKLEELKK